MKFVVPFDGSELSKAALTKAKLYAIALEEAPRELTRGLFQGEPPDIVGVCVIPENARYAREKGWIDQDEEFRAQTVAERLHRQVTDIAPSANFQTVRVDSTGAGTIGNKIRRKAIDLEATDVFIGSENAGRIVTPVSSVGGSVSADERYDVHIVRHELPPKVRKRLRSEFFFTNQPLREFALAHLLPAQVAALLAHETCHHKERHVLVCGGVSVAVLAMDAAAATTLFDA